MRKLLRNIICYFCLLLVFCGLIGCEKKQPGTEMTISCNVKDAKIINNSGKKVLLPFNFKSQENKRYFFRIEASGYETSWVELKSQAHKHLRKEIKLVPLKGSVLIESDPVNCEVIRDNVVIGQTPMIIDDLAFGDYKVYLRRTGYIQKELKWQITGKRPKYIFGKLGVNVGNLQVKSTPEGAELYLNEKLYGETPFADKIESGSYKLTLKKSSFVEKSVQILIEPEKTVSKVIKLEKIPGNLSVKTTPENALVEFDGNEYTTPLELKNIKCGKYDIKISRENCDPILKTVTINPEKTTALEFDLRLNIGGITLYINKPYISVYVDGKFKGYTKPDIENNQQVLPFEVKELSLGKHRVRLSHRFAEPIDTFLTVKVNKQRITSKKVNLWQRNCSIRLYKSPVLKSGFLEAETDDYIIFMPEKGVKITYSKDEIQELKMFNMILE